MMPALLLLCNTVLGVCAPLEAAPSMADCMTLRDDVYAHKVRDSELLFCILAGIEN